jgi:hypothetical protein
MASEITQSDIGLSEKYTLEKMGDMLSVFME